MNLEGKALGKYEIIEEIGRGGMAVVYKAWDTVSNRHVALKVLPPYFQHDTEFLRRFLEEARRTIPLHHPHIVATYEAGQADGYYYIAMEYMSGDSLAARLRSQGRLSLEEATTVVSQIAAALDHAHNLGLIHRDVKPSNILFDQTGQAKLADFGIAKAAGQATVTRPGTLVGTPEYMSPEQGQAKPVDERTDIWSLGVVLYQMLTGRLPFGGENPHVVLFQVVHHRQLPASSLNRDLPQEVNKVLDRVLEKSPRRRYRRAGEMASALRRVVHRPTEEPTVLKGKTELATTRLERVALPRHSPLPLAPLAIFGGLAVLLLVVTLASGIPKPNVQIVATQTALAQATAAQTSVAATQTAIAVANTETAVPTFTTTPIPSVPEGTATPTSTAPPTPTSTVTEASTSTPTTKPTHTPTTVATNTSTSTPTARPTHTPTGTPTHTSTSVPTLTPTSTPVPSTPTDTPTPTQAPPTDTPIPPTNTPRPTDTPAPPTDTPPPSTNTPVPSTDTPAPPPTDTPPPPPTDTLTPPPTDTLAPPPTDTPPPPPTDTPVPPPTDTPPPPVTDTPPPYP
jgi:serine/threonine protein kinase